MGSLNKVASYFDLVGEEVAFGGRGGGRRTIRELSLYVGTVAGALSKTIFDVLSNAQSLELAGLSVAAIGSTVTFPELYRKAHLNKGPLSPMKYFVAFQHGFFWSLILDGVARQLSA